MYRIRKKMAWKMTTVGVKLPDGSIEDAEIGWDIYYQLQKKVHGKWENVIAGKWYSEEDAYDVMKHLICKEKEVEIVEYSYNKN